MFPSAASRTSVVGTGAPLFYGGAPMQMLYGPAPSQPVWQYAQTVQSPSGSGMPAHVMQPLMMRAVPVQAQAPQSIMMVMSPTFPQPPQQQQQQQFLMLSSGPAVYTAAEVGAGQPTYTPAVQQALGAPHTAVYVPQEAPYINGGKASGSIAARALPMCKSAHPQSAARAVPADRRRKDAPVNPDSVCRHFLSGRCNRRKCRFRHIVGEEARAFLAAHSSCVNSRTESTAATSPSSSTHHSGEGGGDAYFLTPLDAAVTGRADADAVSGADALRAAMPRAPSTVSSTTVRNIDEAFALPHDGDLVEIEYRVDEAANTPEGFNNAAADVMSRRAYVHDALRAVTNDQGAYHGVIGLSR